MSGYGVVLFYTTSSALRAEKALVESGVEVKLIPTPRQFSSDCGLALRFPWQDRARVEELLAMLGLQLGGVHPL